MAAMDASKQTIKEKKPKHGKICAAWGCNNYQDINKDVPYFHFPKEKERCDRWIYQLKRADLQGLMPEHLKSRVVCGLHFDISQFTNRQQR